MVTWNGAIFGEKSKQWRFAMKRLGALSLLVCVITLLSGAFATYPIDAKDTLRVLLHHCPCSKKKISTTTTAVLLLTKKIIVVCVVLN